MKNIFVLPLAICLAAFLACEANAQYGTGYVGYGGFGGGQGCGCGNGIDSRMGYCLENDCLGGGRGCGGGCHRGGGCRGGGCGGGCQSGGCGGGCQSGCGAQSVRIRVTVGRGTTQPVVQTFYPQVGCPGCYGNNPQQQVLPNAQVAPSRSSNRYSGSRKTMPRGSASAARNQSGTTVPAKKASYRYKF